MNKKFLRMIILVRTILNENGKLTAAEIKTKVENQFQSYQDIKSLKMDKYSDTTFSNDKTAIKDVWKIDLECDNFNRYSINANFEGLFQNDLLNSVIFLSSLNSDLLLPGFVIPETRKNTGLEHFFSISKAVKFLCK